MPSWSDAIAGFYGAATQELDYDKEIPFPFTHDGVTWPATLKIGSHGVSVSEPRAIVTPWIPGTG